MPPRTPTTGTILTKPLTTLAGISPRAFAIRCALPRMECLRPNPGNGIVDHNDNAAERGRRAVAPGRVNYLFVGSAAGGKVAAIAFTLIETARFELVDPMPGSPTSSPASRTTRSPRSMTCCRGAGTGSGQTGRLQFNQFS